MKNAVVLVIAYTAVIRAQQQQLIRDYSIGDNGILKLTIDGDNVFASAYDFTRQWKQRARPRYKQPIYCCNRNWTIG